MTRIKICGITRAEDAQACAELGADFLGFIFVKESPRYVEPERAAVVGSAAVSAAGAAASRAAALLAGAIRVPAPPPEAGARDAPAPAGEDAGAPLVEDAPLAGVPLFVGVFRDHSIDEIHRIAKIARLDVIQLHGDESDDFVRAIELPVIKALHVRDALPETTSSAQWLMFDSGGGTGRAFDWSLLATYPRTKPFFLAGGITPDNVESAIERARPDAIDLSSGVESAPGVKNHHKLRALFERVKRI